MCPTSLVFSLGVLSMALPNTQASRVVTDPQRLTSVGTAFDKGSPTQRRDVVIQAIDDGVITTGQSLSNVKQVFGRHLMLQSRDQKTHDLNAYVDFREPIRAKDTMRSPAVTGWTIYLRFGEDDILTYYALTNVHKGTAAP